MSLSSELLRLAIGARGQVRQGGVRLNPLRVTIHFIHIYCMREAIITGCIFEISIIVSMPASGPRTAGLIALELLLKALW